MSSKTSKKESFVLHISQYESIKVLQDRDAGRLLKAIYQYAIDQTIKEDLSPVAMMAFTFIKTRMDEDRAHYEAVCEAHRNSGRKGGAPAGNQNARKQDQANQPNGCINKQNNQMVIEETKNNQKQPNVTKSEDTDTDTDTESLKRDKEESKKKTRSSSFSKPIEERQKDFWEELHQDQYLSKYGEDMIKDFYSYWAEGEQNKANPKMRREIQKTWNTSGRLSTWNRRKEQSWK